MEDIYNYMMWAIIIKEWKNWRLWRCLNLGVLKDVTIILY